MKANDIAVELGFWQRMRSAMAGKLIRLRRRFIPYLVWYGQEIDLTVTLKENRLSADTIGGAHQQFFEGHFHKMKEDFKAVGISFDSGLGPSGRDWEWDWSLRGPISLQFRGTAKRPERRV